MYPKRFILFALFICSCISIHAQVVNGYGKVTSLNGTTINLTDVNEIADSFEDGEIVMLIQMQDDVIGGNVNNNNTFGTISNIGSAGNYEFLTIAAHTEISGLPATITFSSAPIKSYNFSPNSSVQIVSLRTLGSPNYSTTGVLTALAWNGSVGGVLAIEVPGTLTLNHSIQANSLGFRGGAKSVNNGSGCVNSSYQTATTGYGFKGEGIHKNSNANFNNARGKIANGGGGGLTHNAGGGGGGNVGTGGIGGIGWQCNAANTGHGLGGQTLFPYYGMNRIFMGGGGGGGQMNNSVGTNGGNGGGIVFVKANQIVTPSVCASPVSITANGQTSLNSGNDGSGGGGAAGTVVVQANIFGFSSGCPVTFAANGGTGGSVNNSGIHGAGGGGGQGAIVFLGNSPTTNYTAQTLNGAAGCNNSAVPCTSFSGVSPEANNLGVFMIVPLGVTFVEFFAETIDRNVLLTWTTASEVNSDFFSVERSSDGVNYTEIGVVQAAGSSQSILDYEFIDQNILEPQKILYYRLKQVDFDGTTMYSEVRTVQIDQQHSDQIVVFPNPFSETLNVFIPQDYISDHTQIILRDGINRTVEIADVQSELTTFFCSELSKGIYLISVIVDGKVIQTEKLVK